MPINKDAYTRYRVIDQTLRQNRFVKTSKLVELCSDRLGKTIKTRTIQKDIVDMKEDTVLQLYAPIEYSQSEKAHFYPDDVQEIFPAVDLLDEEITALLFYGRTLNQYEGGEIFNEISKAIEKILDSINIRKDYRKIAIETENVPKVKGRELLTVILEALKLKKKLSFDYKKFQGETKNRVVNPILLKEDKHMWYLVCQIDERTHFTTFAVDRMTNLKVLDQNSLDLDFNSEEHFKHSFGITVPEEPPVKVILSFTPEQGNYVKALPIHSSQEILEDNEQELKISIMVKPAYEFYSKLLSYGSNVRVISPEAVVKSMKNRLLEAFSKY